MYRKLVVKIEKSKFDLIYIVWYNISMERRFHYPLFYADADL